MASNEGSVSKKIRAVKEGSSRTRAEAISQLFPGLMAGAWRITRPQLRGTGADSEVAAASAARRTLKDIETGRVDTQNRKQLAGLLTQRALDKKDEVLRKSLAKKRGLKVTQSLAEGARNEEGKVKEIEIPVVAEAERLVENDLLQRLAEALPEDCKEVLPLYLAGHSHAEIAARLGISDDAVGRRMKKIEKLGAQLAAGN